MSKINTKYFNITDKCDLLFSNKDGLPFCVYFNTENGEPRCRKKDICNCVETKLEDTERGKYEEWTKIVMH